VPTNLYSPDDALIARNILSLFIYFVTRNQVFPVIVLTQLNIHKFNVSDIALLKV
jgi:hypothetical protein